MTIEDLVKDGYSNKSLDNGYGGYIQTWIGNNDDVITFVNTTNGRYYFQGRLDVVSQPNFLPSKEYAEGLDKVNANTKCPDDVNLPDKNVYNIQSKKITEELEDYIKNNN